METTPGRENCPVRTRRSDGPLATINRARDAVRQRKKTAAGEAFTVYVRGGVYALAAPVRLSAEDSGTAAAPVVYRAYASERPVLMGGREIAGFAPERGEILKADLASQGLQGVYFRQLLFDDRRQPLARWPNFDPAHPYDGGWAHADGKPVNMYEEVPGENKRTFRYKAADQRHWASPSDGEVFVFPRFNWWNDIRPIRAIDRKKREITLAWDASYAIRPGDRYFVQNLREELDAPGEWWLDREDVDALLLAAEAVGRPARLRADAGDDSRTGAGHGCTSFSAASPSSAAKGPR